MSIRLYGEPELYRPGAPKCISQTWALIKIYKVGKGREKLKIKSRKKGTGKGKGRPFLKNALGIGQG